MASLYGVGFCADGRALAALLRKTMHLIRRLCIMGFNVEVASQSLFVDVSVMSGICRYIVCSVFSLHIH